MDNGVIMKKEIILHIICLTITAIFVAVIVLTFRYCTLRVFESLRDMVNSVGYYFSNIFGLDNNIKVTINNPTSMPFKNVLGFPSSWQSFKLGWHRYWQLFLSKANVKAYFSFILDVVFICCQVILFVAPFVLLLMAIFKKSLKKENNDYNQDSKHLRRFKRLSDIAYKPVKLTLIDFTGFIKANRYYYVIWLIIWLYAFNVASMIISFIGFYFYFVANFDLSSIFAQLYKLSVDLSVAIDFIPIWLWVIIGLFMFDVMRKKIGYMRLNHFERKNRGFINERPIVSMTCGTMGKKKTTMVTDMALSQEVMFRDKAFEKILENDLKFPYFPWINFEMALKKAIANHSVYNLATCRRFVKSKYYKWRKRPVKYNCFSYNYDKYPMEYYDELKVVNLWQVLETYAQLYFIYIIQSSLLISNYSIRVDSVMSDVGNFPLWNSDFFESDSRLMDSYSKHANILDFDTLRLGRKVVENNELADSFEFGVVVITEVGKERGNSIELAEKKKKDDVCNQKNDLFNSWLKMVRHSATVDNYPFVKVLTDEQRPESWGADARDLSEIVHIRESGDVQLAMPFFGLETLLHNWLEKRFNNIYYDFRYTRGDNTLFMHVIKTVFTKINNYYIKRLNSFGYCCLLLQVESGTQDGELSERKYYLMSKKIYSKRFSTDCFSDFFTQKALRSAYGIEDLPGYKGVKATFGELEKQNSYFINDLLKGFNYDEKK